MVLDLIPLCLSDRSVYCVQLHGYRMSSFPAEGRRRNVSGCVETGATLRTWLIELTGNIASNNRRCGSWSRIISCCSPVTASAALEPRNALLEKKCTPTPPPIVHRSSSDNMFNLWACLRPTASYRTLRNVNKQDPQDPHPGNVWNLCQWKRTCHRSLPRVCVCDTDTQRNCTQEIIDGVLNWTDGVRPVRLVHADCILELISMRGRIFALSTVDLRTAEDEITRRPAHMWCCQLSDAAANDARSGSPRNRTHFWHDEVHQSFRRKSDAI